MRKLLIGFVLLVACNNGDAARVAKLEVALQECRAQKVQTDQADISPPSTKQVFPVGEIASARTASVQPVSVAAGQFSVLTVDHSQPWSGVEQEFGYVSSNINDERFSVEPGGISQVAIAPLKLHRDGEEWISTDEAVKRMSEQGTRPATGREARAYAKANPEVQRQFPIVALGSSWVDLNGDRLVPYLVDWRGERALDLDWTGGDWNSGWRFLAARK